MATPNVTGVLAHLLQKKKCSFTTSPDIVKEALFCDTIKDRIQGIFFPQRFGTAVINLLLQVSMNKNNSGGCLFSNDCITSSLNPSLSA
jgi:hypothetical protein